MSTLRWFIIVLVVCFAAQIALTIILAIIYDMLANKNGWSTISEEIWDINKTSTTFIVLLTLVVTAPIFLLLGHLLFNRN